MTEQPSPTPRYFVLERTADVSGISGLGRVAEGFVFEDGVTVLRWLTEHRSTAIYSSVQELEAIHGHNGSTQIVPAALADSATGPTWCEHGVRNDANCSQCAAIGPLDVERLLAEWDAEHTNPSGGEDDCGYPIGHLKELIARLASQSSGASDE